MPTIESSSVRVQACEVNGRYRLEFAASTGPDIWTTILATGLYTPPSIFSVDEEFICEDPIVEWCEPAVSANLQSATAFLTAVEADEDARSLLLRGVVDCHDYE
ncbi:MAG TPA: hypothetical protein VHB98_09120, partial [Chloroflexota bacterium]|nr:hypothetical protein [Chloroflexota bacterium]